MLLALTANAEKINPMSQNLKTGFFSNLFCQVFRATQIRIYNFFTLHANHMWVRVWLVAVIAVTAIWKANLYQFVDPLKQRYSLINCGKAGSRELCSNDLVDPFDGRMPLTYGEHF